TGKSLLGGPGAGIVPHDGVDHEFDVWSEHLPAKPRLFDVFLQGTADPYLDRLEALLDISIHLRNELLAGCIVAATGIDSDGIVGLASEQFVEGDSQRLRLDVPQRDFYRTGHH